MRGMRGSARSTAATTAKVRFFFLPTPLTRHSQLFPTLTGGPDLRTREYRPKKAKRALLMPMVNGLPTLPRSLPSLGDAWPTDDVVETLVCDAAQLQALPGPAEEGAPAIRAE